MVVGKRIQQQEGIHILCVSPGTGGVFVPEKAVLWRHLIESTVMKKGICRGDSDYRLGLSCSQVPTSTLTASYKLIVWRIVGNLN